MKNRWLALAFLIALVLPASLMVHAQAVPGAPFSSDAGFGAKLELDGRVIPQSLRAAGIIHLDWISITFDWANHWPDANAQPDIASLDNAMMYAGQNKLGILLRLTHAPDWAKSSAGPDVKLTSWFIANLITRYPGTLQAIELFPSANTAAGWGAEPNPQAYTNLLCAVSTAIRDTRSSVFIVAPGLTPLPALQPSQNDIDDLTFLQGLYDAGAATCMPVVSINLPVTTGDPLKAPGENEHRVLRHYEDVRQVMLANQHESGLIWITEFQLPSGQIEPNDVSYNNNASGQAQWLNQAYNQLRSQLYIGVAFLTTINSPTVNLPESAASVNLIRANSSKHPFYNILKDLILESNPSKVILLDFSKPQSKNIIKDRSSPP